MVLNRRILICFKTKHRLIHFARFFVEYNICIFPDGRTDGAEAGVFVGRRPPNGAEMHFSKTKSTIIIYHSVVKAFFSGEGLFRTKQLLDFVIRWKFFSGQRSGSNDSECFEEWMGQVMEFTSILAFASSA